MGTWGAALPGLDPGGRSPPRFGACGVVVSGVASITHSTHVRTKITKLRAQNMNHGNKTLFF